ncbi:MAG: hypothetical protein Q9217_004453 [Psora testacea]
MVLTVAIPRETPCQCKKNGKTKQCTCAKCSCFYETRVDKKAIYKAPKVNPQILQQREAIREACHSAERNLATSSNNGDLEGGHNNSHVLQNVQLRNPVSPSSPQDQPTQASSESHTNANTNQANSLNSPSSPSNWSTVPPGASHTYSSAKLINFENSQTSQHTASQQLSMPVAAFDESYSQAPAVTHPLSVNFLGSSPPRPYISRNSIARYQQTAQQQQMTQYMPDQIASHGPNIAACAGKNNIASSGSWNIQYPSLHHPHIEQYNIPQDIGTRDHPVTLAHQQQLQNDPGFFQEVPRYASQGVIGIAAPGAETDPTRPCTKRRNSHVCNCGPGCRCVFCIAHPYNESSQRQVAEASRTLEADIHNHSTTSSDTQIYGMHPTIDPRILGTHVTHAGNQDGQNMQSQQVINSGAVPLIQQNWSNQEFPNPDDTIRPIQTMDSSNYFHVEYSANGSEPWFSAEEPYINQPQ